MSVEGFAIGFFASCLLLSVFGFLYLVGMWPSPSGRDQISLAEIEQRMRLYAILKEPSRKNVESIEHEVLLGMLKKIEGKNASLAVVLVFLSGGVITASGSNMGDLVMVMAAPLLLLLLPLLISALLGMRHVGDGHFLKLSKRLSLEGVGSSDFKAFAEEMQKNLMYDLYMKERVFQFAWIGAIAVTVVFFISLVLA